FIASRNLSQNQYRPKPAITDNNIPIKKSFVAKPIAIVENGIDRNVNSVLIFLPPHLCSTFQSLAALLHILQKIYTLLASFHLLFASYFSPPFLFSARSYNLHSWQ